MSLLRTQHPFESLFNLPGSDLQASFLRAFDVPERAATTLRASEDQSGYVIRVEIPGTAPEDVVVETRDRVLEIAIKTADSETAAWTRSIRVPNDADLDRAEAEYLHGVLTVTLPKKEEAQPRQIEIRVP